MAVCKELRAALLVFASAAIASAQDSAKTDYAQAERPGIEEKLGESVPLDVTFLDEEGKTVSLGSLITRPTILMLVYLRCPNICSPLLREVAATVDKLDVEPGIDFDLITVSFDTSDTPELAKTGKANLLASMERRIPPESWRFLTGGEENISRLTDAAGFRFRREKQDFVHAGTVIFLSPAGKIVRYLPGLTLLPADVKMALIDAAAGTPRRLMLKLQRLCYSFDSDAKTYVFKVNRIVLAVTLFIVAVFLAVLLLRRKSPAAGREAT
ncbi:MAG: SCO family protein [Planctomycetes bacterium]|nr:SCO family protein [Planctomycetota bacterium]